MAPNIFALGSITQAAKCTVRLKVKNYSKPGAWNGGAIIPTSGYIEINGPWLVCEVEWLEINPVVMEHIGRLVAPRRLDSTSQIETALHEAHLSYTISNGIIKVPFTDTVEQALG